MAHLAARRLTTALLALMVGQSVAGIVFAEQYRDVEWIRHTWFGNDLITLAIAVPLLGAGLAGARRGTARGTLLWLGGLGYAAYNYAFYLLGAALNVFFPIYVAAVILSAAALIAGLSRLDRASVAAAFAPGTPVRVVGGYLVVVAAGLSAVWFGLWAAYVFAGRPTPIETEAFRLVAALDTTWMVPVLGCGGVLLWRRRPWGFVIAPVAGIQGSLYLMVLALNAALAIARGRDAFPGELAVWGPLAACTTLATVVLLWHVREHG